MSEKHNRKGWSTKGEVRARGVFLPFRGNCPVQGFGKVDGHVCYFRARDRGWGFEVWEKGVDAEADDHEWFSGHLFYFGDGTAFEPFAGGWIQAGEARRLIAVGVAAFRAWTRAGRPDQGWWWSGRRRCARKRPRMRAGRFARGAVLEHVAFASGRVCASRSTPRPGWAKRAEQTARCFMTLEGYAWSPAEVLRKAKTFHAYELYFWVAMEGEHYQMRRISDRIAKETGSIFAKWFNDRPRRSAELSDATVEALGSVATYPGWKATKTDGPDASFCTDPLAAIQKLLERPDQPHPVPPIELMHAVEWGKAARGEPAVNIFGIPVSVNPHLPADTIAAVDAAGKVHVVRNVGNGVPLSPSEAGQDGAGPVESRGGNEQALVQPSAGSPPNGGTA